jgi:hypothetical protein
MSKRPRRRRTAAEDPGPQPAGPQDVLPDDAPAGIARPWLGIVGGAVAVAAVLRFLCARGDLWLDEVWTMALLSSIESPFQIVTRLAHDNNHILNSLFAWGLRGLGSDFALRIPAVLAGTAGVAVAAGFAALPDEGSRDPSRPGVRAALAALLLATSYLMVHYQSEARGYALALGIGLLSPWAFLRANGEAGSRLVKVHWAAASLALLGHAVAVHLFAATFAWSLARFRRDGLMGPRLVRVMVWWHGVPAAFAAVLYLGFLRRMAIGGGPEESLPDVLGRVVAYTLGFPLSLGTLTLLVLGAALVVGGLVALRRLGSDQWVFYATGIVFSPVLALLFQPGDLRFERYFYVSAALLLLLVARLLALLAARASVAALLAVVLFLGGQYRHLQRLIADGRGDYGVAVAHMMARAPGRPVRVASDHDFRNALVISYQAARQRVQDQLVYTPSAAFAASGADWYVVHRPADAPPPPSVFRDTGGRTYQLDRSLPSAPLSGFHWFLFKREGAAP